MELSDSPLGPRKDLKVAHGAKLYMNNQQVNYILRPYYLTSQNHEYQLKSLLLLS